METTPPTSKTEHPACINCRYCCMWDCSCSLLNTHFKDYDTPAQGCPDFEWEELDTGY